MEGGRERKKGRRRERGNVSLKVSEIMPDHLEKKNEPLWKCKYWKRPGDHLLLTPPLIHKYIKKRLIY